MAKITSPLFSQSASGSVGKHLTFRTLPGAAVALHRPIASTSKTTAQIAQRAKYKAACTGWNALSAPTKATWAATGALSGITGFNAYVRHTLTLTRVYAKWSATNKSTLLQISGSDKTLTHSSTSGWCSGRSTIGKSAGKWYWEITNNTEGANGNFIGVANSSNPLGTYPGGQSGSNGIGYFGFNGNVYFSGAPYSYGAAYDSGKTIGVALDADIGKVTFFNEGVSQGQPTYVTTGEIFAAIGSYDSGSSFTANFGESTFLYTPPAGYNAGLYSE